MFRYIAAAGLPGVLALATSLSAQQPVYPNQPGYPPGQPAWGYPAHQSAYPDDPGQLVRSWYQRFLGREPDTQGFQTWMRSLREGQTPEAILAAMLASPEYFQRAGNTPTGFIQKLYRDLAGQEPTQREYQYWAQRIAYGDRQDIIYALLQRYPQTANTTPQYDPRVGSPYDYDYRRPFSGYNRR